MKMKIDEYNLEAIIGKGFGNVYLTSVKDDPKKYVTKVYERKEIENNAIMDCLRREVISLRDLNHPNIIKIKDNKKNEKQYFLIYEYCNGGKLSQALEKYLEKYQKPFPEEIVQHLMKQIIDAIKYIHGKKIIHRNINLDNILLNYENEGDSKNINLMKAKIKITDFYYSEIIYDDMWDTKEPPNFNIKSIMKNSKNTIKLGNNEEDDIYSIGTICYQMLIGKRIFKEKEIENSNKQIKKSIYFVPNILSYEIVSFINGMLQSNPYKRLTASELSRHYFLNKDIRQFKIIKLVKGNPVKIQSNEIDISNIWSIFDKKEEWFLSSILGSQCVKPIA